MAAGRMAALVHVRLMASLPYLAAGLQIAAPAAFLGAMVGEFTGAERGMGVLTIRAMRALDVEMTWALATVATAVSMLAYLASARWPARVLQEAPPVILRRPGRRGRSAARQHIAARRRRCARAPRALVGARSELFDLNPFFAKGPGDVFAAPGSGPPTPPKPGPRWRGSGGNRGLPPARATWPGSAAGAGLAILLLLVPAVAGTAMPLAIALRSVPIVTTAPLVVLLLGRGAVGHHRSGRGHGVLSHLRRLPARVCARRRARSSTSSTATPRVRSQRLIRVRIPAMLPAFFAAARMAVPGLGAGGHGGGMARHREGASAA